MVRLVRLLVLLSVWCVASVEATVAHLLHGHGLLQYHKYFVEHGVARHDLPLLTDADLIEIGVTAAGPRNEILSAIATDSELGREPVVVSDAGSDEVNGIYLGFEVHDESPVYRMEKIAQNLKFVLYRDDDIWIIAEEQAEKGQIAAFPKSNADSKEAKKGQYIGSPLYIAIAEDGWRGALPPLLPKWKNRQGKLPAPILRSNTSLHSAPRKLVPREDREHTKHKIAEEDLYGGLAAEVHVVENILPDAVVQDLISYANVHGASFALDDRRWDRRGILAPATGQAELSLGFPGGRLALPDWLPLDELKAAIVSATGLGVLASPLVTLDGFLGTVCQPYDSQLTGQRCPHVDAAQGPDKATVLAAVVTLFDPVTTPILKGMGTVIYKEISTDSPFVDPESCTDYYDEGKASMVCSHFFPPSHWNSSVFLNDGSTEWVMRDGSPVCCPHNVDCEQIFEPLFTSTARLNQLVLYPANALHNVNMADRKVDPHLVCNPETRPWGSRLTMSLFLRVKYDTNDPDADHTHRAMDLEDMGRTPESLQSFAAAARFSQNSSVEFTNLAIAKQSAGDGDGAFMALLRTMRLDPTDELAQEMLLENTQEHGVEVMTQHLHRAWDANLAQDQESQDQVSEQDVADSVDGPTAKGQFIQALFEGLREER
jgi:hypothetical protein